MLRRNAPDSKHGTRCNQLDLASQIRRAARGFSRRRITIIRRPALENIRDEYIFAREPNGTQHRIQQTPGPPDKGFSLPIFVGARCLANNHQVGIALSDTEYRLGSRPVRLDSRPVRSDSRR